jgi:nitrate reductase alpha subunit
MTSSTLPVSDIVLPAATWYEKHDLSSTDMHPYVHSFTPAIDPPWETKSDYDDLERTGRTLADLAEGSRGEADHLRADAAGPAARSSPRPEWSGSETAAGATPRSPSTSSGSSPGTP